MVDGRIAGVVEIVLSGLAGGSANCLRGENQGRVVESDGLGERLACSAEPDGLGGCRWRESVKNVLRCAESGGRGREGDVDVARAARLGKACGRETRLSPVTEKSEAFVPVTATLVKETVESP